MSYYDVISNPLSFQRWQQLEVFCQQYLINNNYHPLDDKFNQISYEKYMTKKINNNTKYYDGLFIKDDIIYVFSSKCLQTYTEHSLGINDLKIFCQQNIINKKYQLIFGVDNNFKLKIKEATTILKFDDVVQFKTKIQLKPYQQKFIYGNINKIINNKNIIIDCMCRFGKSYIMKYLQEYFNWSVQVITTKPTETSHQYVELGLDYISIQKMKVGSYNINEDADILFIDEPQESFMTELTESTIDLRRFRKIIYFTGTSQKLQLYLDDYVLCHYNFGDYLIDEDVDKPLFPKIRFINSLPEDYSQLNGITLVFDRSMSLDELRDEIKEKKVSGMFKLQSSVDDTDLLTATQGVYLLNKQYTTGITIPNCYNVVIRHSNFTETDIQSIFRCFNTNDLSVQRYVFIKDPQMLRDMLVYIYRQTGRNYINSNNIQLITKKLLGDDTTFDYDMDSVDLQLDSSVISKMFKQFIKYRINDNFEHIISKSVKQLIDSIKPQNETQRLIVDTIRNIQTGSEVNEKYIILMTRLIIQLSLDSYQLKLKTKLNKNNQDFSATYLWNQITDFWRLDQIFESFSVISSRGTQDNQAYLTIIFEIYDKFNKSQMIKYIYELIQSDDVLDKYKKLQHLYKTTQDEHTINAEILTPDWLVDKMLKEFQEQVPNFFECEVSVDQLKDLCDKEGIEYSDDKEAKEEYLYGLLSDKLGDLLNDKIIEMVDGECFTTSAE